MIERLKQLNWQYWLGLAFFIFVVGSLTVAIERLYAKMSSQDLRPMSQLLIVGERVNVSDQDLQLAINQLPKVGNFFSLDVAAVQQQLQALPWVKQVTVRKQWPDKLRVQILEQQAKARWNNAALLNQSGEIFEAPQFGLSDELISLSGPDAEVSEVLAVSQSLRQQFEPFKIKISQLDLSPSHAWAFELSNGVKVNLGQEDRDNRVERFLAIYPQLDIEKVAYIDLRYDAGLAVGKVEE